MVFVCVFFAQVAAYFNAFQLTVQHEQEYSMYMEKTHDALYILYGLIRILACQTGKVEKAC